MISHFKMIIDNLLRKLFTKGKSSFFGQNINNLKKTSLSKNPVVPLKKLQFKLRWHKCNTTKEVSRSTSNLYWQKRLNNDILISLQGSKLLEKAARQAALKDKRNKDKEIIQLRYYS